MNPYTVLGVSESASDEEIASAYKKLAKRYHPDLHPNDQAAAEQMGKINSAYNDIKRMRASGQSYSQYTSSQRPGAGYSGDPFTGNPFTGASGYTYTYYNPFSGYTRGRGNVPRSNPIMMILVVFSVFMLVRLLISILFGGFGGSYYVNNDSDSQYVPGYGITQTEPAQQYSGYYYSFPGQEGSTGQGNGS